jgi:hypothetical protein
MKGVSLGIGKGLISLARGTSFDRADAGYIHKNLSLNLFENQHHG